MKLLVVTWYFPPTNTIAAVRLGRMCRDFIGHGHEVRVITGRDLPFPQTLPLEIPARFVSSAAWSDPNRLPSAAIAALRTALPRRRRSGAMPGAGDPGEADAPRGGGATGRLKASFWGALNWPDPQIGWRATALRAGREVLDGWRPDLIFASGPPFTTFLIGDRLARRARAPWVAEYRDRWSDDPYYPPPAWLGALDRWAERRIVARAAGVVTVSQPWAEIYRRRFGKPTRVIYNGFDERLLEAGAEHCAGSPGPALRIVYTGGIYPGRRDPSPLFQALRHIPDFEQAVRIEFYGTDPALVVPLAERHGVSAATVVHPGVRHDEAIRQQQAADVLLLMQWNDPREQGNVPGKFFEYLGARRPVLVLGLEDGVPATILRERGAGVCLNEPQAIAARLGEWLAAKRRDGRIPALPEAARAGFSRREQNQALEDFLAGLVSRDRP